MISAEKGTILPLGARTQTDFGNPLRRVDCAIDLSRLHRITEYNPADLTIHVEAGVTLGQLQHALLENNQFLPLDPWNGPEATVGGIAAANAQGPLRATGTIRDWIIENEGGRNYRSNLEGRGPCCENVTGTICRNCIRVRSGTLAIIAEISLKLARQIRPGRQQQLFKPATPMPRPNSFGQFARARCNPIACEWVGPEK